MDARDGILLTGITKYIFLVDNYEYDERILPFTSISRLR